MSGLDIEPLHLRFGARLHGVDLAADLSPEVLDLITDAFETHSVLVFPGQSLRPEDQVRFAGNFGPLEKAVTRLSDSGPGQHVAHLSNVDASGKLIPPSERQQLNNAANRFWHTDSSFKPQPALTSMLFAVEVPPTGGETEFVSTREGFRSLPAEAQEKVRGLWAVHDFQRSRDLVAPDLVPPEVQRSLPPVPRPLCRINPVNGEEALYIASHATCIQGMDDVNSRTVLDELLAHCTRQAMIYTHAWTQGELVMWDNRCTMHRGRTWDAARHRRIMNRTTVIDVGYDSEPGIRAA